MGHVSGMRDNHAESGQTRDGREFTGNFMRGKPTSDFRHVRKTDIAFELPIWKR
jgi:hypothetical protein